MGNVSFAQVYDSTTCSSFWDSKGCCETRGGWTREWANGGISLTEGDCILPDEEAEENPCDYPLFDEDNKSCLEKYGTGSKFGEWITENGVNWVCCTAPDDIIQDCNPACTDGKECSCTPEGCTCVATPTTLPDDVTVNWITIGTKCLLNGQCKFNVYDALGIRKSVRSEGDATSVGLFVQDIVLAVTMFIGTVVTIAIIVSGLMWIMAGATGKDPTKAKSWLINALIGLLIVTCSYLIIRVVQYIAKWV